MNATEAFQELRDQITKDTPVDIVLGAFGIDSPYRKTDITLSVAAHFRGIAMKAADAPDLTLDAEKFQPDAHSDGRLVYLAPTELPALDQLTSAIINTPNMPFFTGDSDFVSALRFYTIRAHLPGGPALFFRRANAKQELQRKGFAAKLAGHRFTEFKEKVFLFDDHVDFITYQGFTFLLTRKPFQDLFKDELRAAFAKLAKPAVDLLTQQLEFENSEEFRAAVNNDERLSAPLARLHERNALQKATMAYVLEKNALFTKARLAVVNTPGGPRIKFEPSQKTRYLLTKILEEKVHQGELTGTPWIANSQVAG